MYNRYVKLNVFIYYFIFVEDFKMTTENVKFRLTGNNALILSHLAAPKSAKILINGRWVSTEKYDIYGAPILSSALLSMFRNELSIAEALGKPYYIQVKYTELLPSYSDTIFSNSDYIELKMHSIRGFIEYLTDIQQYRKAYPNYNNFGEYVLYSKFLINKNGSIWILEDEYDLPVITDFANFKALYNNFLISPFPIERLSNFCSICPYCLQELSLKDLLFDTIDWCDSLGISHKECHLHSDSLKNEAIILSIMHDSGWENYDYAEVLFNFDGMPHFIIHTTDGDIEISWRNELFTLKFMENFSDFPMSILNKDIIVRDKCIQTFKIYHLAKSLTDVHNYLH